jgi:hypothetical protein
MKRESVGRDASLCQLPKVSLMAMRAARLQGVDSDTQPSPLDRASRVRFYLGLAEEAARIR